MTEEEIEVVAQELAKVGGVSWYPGRTSGSLLRPLSERYRDRARVAIAALERLKASKEGLSVAESQSAADTIKETRPERTDELQVGATVIYRAPGEKRALSCRIEKLEEGRAYLVPCPQPDVGWVALDSFSLSADDTQAA